MRCFWEGPWIGDERVTLRDAGIDVNVPFPALVGNAKRRVNVLLVLDASGNAEGNEELARAVRRGYVQVREEDMKRLGMPFAITEVARVFWPPVPDQPVIVYMVRNAFQNDSYFFISFSQAWQHKFSNIQV